MWQRRRYRVRGGGESGKDGVVSNREWVKKERGRGEVFEAMKSIRAVNGDGKVYEKRKLKQKKR